MKKTIQLVLVFGALIFISGCGLYGNSSGSSSPSKTPAGSVQPAADANSVSIQGFAFNPGTLTVKTGATVTWTNNDSVIHTIKSDTFHSGNIAKGDTFQFTFTSPGTFNYSCGIHPSMTGKIVVE
jgi:plastocyanin